MPKLKPGTLVPTEEEDAVITAAAMRDPDARPYTDEEWMQAKPRRGRGRPVQEITKVPTSIRLDVRVVSAFKATGEGWQTRMNQALLEYALSHEMISQE